MSYITTNFREFVKQQIIQETRKEKTPTQPKETTEIKQKDWMTELREEFERVQENRA